MPILTPDDKDLYFPEVTLEDEPLQAAIWRAEAIAEGPRGANRNLSIAPYSQTTEVRLNQQVCFVPHWPIVEITSIEAQQAWYSACDSWGRVLPALDWTELLQAEYSANPITGEITLLGQRAFTEARIIYTAGWDFRSNNFDANRIKQIVGQILLYQQSAIGLGYKSDGDVDLQVQAVGAVPDEYLIPLHAFRARPTVF